MKDEHVTLAVGILLLAVALYVNIAVPFPGPNLVFLLRVVVALSAACVGAAIPGYLGFEARPVKAGGAIALFGLVFMMNPPELLVEHRYDRLTWPGDSALERGNLSRAEDLYNEALGKAPSAWEPNFGLARVAYRSGDFAEANEQFRQVIEKKRRLGEEVSPLDQYQLALTLDGQGNYERALGVLSEIEKSADPSSNLYTDVLFDIGLLNLLLALDESDPVKRAELRKAAKAGFDRYEKVESKPTEWYHYHMACLAASEDGSLSSDNKARTLKGFELATATIDRLPPDVARAQKQILRDMFAGRYRRQPGHPVDCPALYAVVKEAHPDLSRVLGS